MTDNPTLAEVEAAFERVAVDIYQHHLEDAEEPIAPRSRTLTWLALAVGAFLLALLVGIPALQFVALSVLVVLFLRAIDYMDRRRR